VHLKLLLGKELKHFPFASLPICAWQQQCLCIFSGRRQPCRQYAPPNVRNPPKYEEQQELTKHSELKATPHTQPKRHARPLRLPLYPQPRPFLRLSFQVKKRSATIFRFPRRNCPAKLFRPKNHPLIRMGGNILETGPCHWFIIMDKVNAV